MKYIKFLIYIYIFIIPNLIFAQNFPSYPVTLVVPNAPGGGIDILARLLERGLSESWGQPVIIVYKPGAGTVLGTDFVAKSHPDGHTIGIVVAGHLINPSLRKNMPFDTLKDLSGISMMATSPILISATNSLPANNIKELMALSKLQPGKLSYASPGNGTSMHMGGELLKYEMGVDIVHVPYVRPADAYTDVFTGRVQLHIGTLSASLPYIKAGKMKAIAVMGAHRSVASPDTPVVAETLPGFAVESMFGAVVPSATPRVVVNRISNDIAQVLQSPTVRQRMSEIGLVPVASKPEEFDAYIRAEIPKWAKVVKALGATAD